MWQAPLDLDDDHLGALVAVLPAAERAGADALRDPEARRRWLAEHGWRRRVLATASGRPEVEIAYAIGEHGKPRLAPAGPHFSASRAGAVALYAVCGETEVGVDVEAVGADAGAGDREPLARRLLAPAERAAYDSIPPDARAAALTACWARKEAYLKTLGTGLVFPLTDLELWVGDERPVRRGEIVVHPLALDPQLAAAVGVRLAPGQVAWVPASPRVLTPADAEDGTLDAG